MGPGSTKPILQPKIRDEILEEATALGGMGFFARFRRRDRGQILR
jgi:hypothetical protein